MAKAIDAFRTISEVASWLDTPAHVLRFWESKFTQVKPVKRAGGRRYYRPADMMLLSGIKKLLHEDGITIKGVQKILKEQGVKHVSSFSQPLETDGDSGHDEAALLDSVDESGLAILPTVDELQTEHENQANAAQEEVTSVDDVEPESAAEVDATDNIVAFEAPTPEPASKTDQSPASEDAKPQDHRVEDAPAETDQDPILEDEVLAKTSAEPEDHAPENAFAELEESSVPDVSEADAEDTAAASITPDPIPEDAAAATSDSLPERDKMREEVSKIDISFDSPALKDTDPAKILAARASLRPIYDRLSALRDRMGA